MNENCPHCGGPLRTAISFVAELLKAALFVAFILVYSFILGKIFRD